MKKMTIDGNEACARASYMFTQVAGIYPITPSSTMPELIEKWSNSGKKNIFGEKVQVIEMQSESGAIGLVHGLLQSGVLANTYTASQGLLLMIPNMYKIAGELLPCVINVASRSIAMHALSIFGDHQDVYATRGTGFCMMASSSVQDAYFLSLVSHLAAIKSSLPFLNFFDGFRTSHEYNKISVFSDDELTGLLDDEAYLKFKNRALSIHNPVTRGTNQNGDIYFQQVEAKNTLYENVISDVAYYMNMINLKSGMNYKPFNYYGDDKAERIIVAMGSVCETIKDVVDHMSSAVGLIEVHLYRPFSVSHLLGVLPDSVRKVAVLDRAKEHGSSGEPLYLDIVNALKDKNIMVVGGRYGLASKNTTPGMIKAVYDMLDEPKNNFTIGIDDDVTNLSLPYTEFSISSSLEMLVYGYGSDGMVSACKSLLEMVGDNTEKFVQGYFEYDSKKSGGVTIGHLRFADKMIRQTYFVSNPKFVVITKDSYITDFDAISNISYGGTLFVNTSRNDGEILSLLAPYKDILNERKINLFVIDAYDLARKNNLGNKISMIMASAILKVTGLINYDYGIEYIKKFIKNKFGKMGQDLVLDNINGVSESAKYIRRVKLDDEFVLKDENFDFYSMIAKRKGNELKVSDFMNCLDGSFKHTVANGRCISDYTVEYIKENCIKCGMCAMVCPHGVIRPFLLDEDEYNKAPNSIKEKCIKDLAHGGYFVIGISKKNCTGCGVCTKICPGKKGEKALVFEKTVLDNDFDYLINNVSYKSISTNTIKDCQLKECKFAFSGACMGCGETAYIKLLTQLFGDNMIIANATGCSSIYGASMPDMPYSVPWINSLFEDNAEFGFGILSGYDFMRKNIYDYMKKQDDKLCKKWLENCDDYEVTKEVYDCLDYKKHPYLALNKNYIIKPSIWAIGGDGWAYDIGFSGIDHVLSSGKDINILVLDTQVYSNTGGQASKATPRGAMVKFASDGKKGAQKDLARIAMCYPNVYVAQVSLGANMMQVLRTFKEAESHKGPSIVIAYCPCISHGIKGGMSNSVIMESLAVKCGYFPIFRYDGERFVLDSKNVCFDLYDDFLRKQGRFSDESLFAENKNDAMKRYAYYSSLETTD